MRLTGKVSKIKKTHTKKLETKRKESCDEKADVAATMSEEVEHRAETPSRGGVRRGLAGVPRKRCHITPTTTADRGKIP